MAITYTKPRRVAAFAPRTVLGRAVAGFFGITFMVIAALAMSFSTEKLVLNAIDVGSLPSASPPPGMSMSALPTGSYESPAALTFNGGSWRETRHLAATAVLIRHPLGNLLIDTGFGKHVDGQMGLLPSLQRSSHVKGLPVIDQLTKVGLRTSDLAGVIPTHSHWDHISGLEDLPGVPVLETSEGMAFISAKGPGTEVINSLGKINYKQYKFDGGPYLGFPRSHDVWGDGSVVIVPAPGHTPDSVAVFVTLPSGKRYALIGDVVFQRDGLDLPAEKPWLLRRLIGENRHEVNLDIARITSARAKFPQIVFIPAHDLSTSNGLPVFPASMR